MALLATSLACARALAHPASSPAGISVADADAHLRAVQASADGFAIARAILGAADEATETRVVGATMLRAKARTDGFAIAPDAAAAMTRELLDLLRGPDACTALGPHLAALAAAVAAAGGAETLGALVDEAVAYAAPDARGGWPTPDEVKNGARAATVGPGAHAAVALLAACAEESVHRPRRGAGGAATAAAARDRVDDVVFVLDAVAATDRAGWCAEEGSDGASTMIVPPWTFPADAPRGYRRGDDALLRAPLRHALPEALNVAARRCLCLWIPAGIALSELATRRGGSLLAATLAAVFEEGDEAAAEATETALASVDPLPGRDDAAALVASAAEAFASAANRDGVDVFAASFPPEIRLAATRVVAALALAEPKAFAATPGEGGSRATSAFLLRAIERAEPRVARVALASLRGRAGGVLEALRRTRRPELEGTCERAIGAVLTRRANGAALAWLRERVEAADRRAREAEGTDEATRDAVVEGGPVDAFVARGAERRSRWREVADAARDELDGAVVRALEAAPGELADAEEEASLASDLDDALARVRAVAGNAPFFETVRRFLLDRPGEYAVGQMNPNPPGENDAWEFRRTVAALEAIGACGSSESFDAAADRVCRDALARATATTERAAAANPELASPLLTSYARAAREVGGALALRDPEGVSSRGVDALARTLVAAVFGVAFEGGGGVGPAGDPRRPSAASLAAASAAAAGALAALFDRAAAVARALDWRHTPPSLADAEALRVALAHACETTRRFAVEGAGYAAAAAAKAAEGDPNVHRSADAPSGVVAPFFFPSARDVSLVSSRAFAFAVALERRVETSAEEEREWRDRVVPDLGFARVRAAIRAAAAGVADAAASFPTVSSSASAETLFLDAAALAPLAALEAWARSGAPSGLLASGDADGERLVARAVGASEAAALKIIADARVVPSAAGNRDAPLRDAAFARIRGTWSGVATAASVLHAAGPRRHEYAARAAETARHLTLTSAGAVSPFIGAALALSADLLAGVAPAAADDAFDARVRRPIADVIDSTAATLTLRPDADPDVVEALFHAAEAEARARAARMGGSGSEDAMQKRVVGSSPATTQLALATIRRGAAVGARLAAIRFAEATFAAPAGLTTSIDRSDPAKTQAVSTLPVDGFATGALLPASFFALAKNLAALAGEAEDPAFLEPIANALWTASDSARRVGAESALASALVAALSGAADAFEVCEPPAGARFASAAEAEGAAFAFARGVATRTPPHPARRLAELVAVFGLACRGQGPIAAVVELQ